MTTSSNLGRPRVPKVNGYSAAYWRSHLQRNEIQQDTIRRKSGPNDSRLKKMAETARKYRAFIARAEELARKWTAEQAAPGQDKGKPKKLPANCHMTVYGIGVEMGDDIFIRSPATPPTDDPLHALAKNNRQAWLTPGPRGVGYFYTGPLIAPEEEGDG